MKKSLKQWIKENREMIDNHIKYVCPNCSIFNDNERRQWVENDESLYWYAKSENVNV